MTPRRNAGRRRPACRHPDCPLHRLLDEDHVGGLLARIRAVAYLIGVASEPDPLPLRAAGWLVESLADEAQRRLEAAVRDGASGGCQRRQRPV